MRLTLNKRNILRDKRRFHDAFACGRRINGTYLRCQVLRDSNTERSAGCEVLVGCSIPRRVGNAVRRNRIKRLIRESFRLNQLMLAPLTERITGSISLVFLYSPGAGKCPPSFSAVETDMKRILGAVFQTTAE